MAAVNLIINGLVYNWSVRSDSWLGLYFCVFIFFLQKWVNRYAIVLVNATHRQLLAQNCIALDVDKADDKVYSRDVLTMITTMMMVVVVVVSAAAVVVIHN